MKKVDKKRKAMYNLVYRLKQKGMIVGYSPRVIKSDESKPETWWENLTKRTRRQIYRLHIDHMFNVGTTLSAQGNEPAFEVWGKLIDTHSDGVVMEVDICDMTEPEELEDIDWNKV